LATEAPSATELLGADQHVGQVVLDGLEAADGAAELLPYLGVGQCVVQCGLSAAGRLRGGQCAQQADGVACGTGKNGLLGRLGRVEQHGAERRVGTVEAAPTRVGQPLPQWTRIGGRVQDVPRRTAQLLVGRERADDRGEVGVFAGEVGVFAGDGQRHGGCTPDLHHVVRKVCEIGCGRPGRADVPVDNSGHADSTENDVFTGRGGR